MKSNLYIIIQLFIIGLLSAGCDKQLDKQPLNQVSEGNYWTNANDAVMFATQAYNFLPDQNFVYYEAFSDNAFSKSASINTFGNGTFTALNTGRDFDYASIRHCLLFLRDVDRVPNMDATLKARLSAEVKFVLAFRYFLMTSLYRDVPLVTKVFEKASDANLPKNTRTEIVTQIISWLTEAIPALPAKYNDAADNGRVTKGAAYALLSKVYLLTGDYANAAIQAKNIMDLNVYSLLPDYYSFFQEVGDYSSEDILSYGYAGLAGTPTANTMRNVLGSLLQLGNNLINPTAELVGDYESNQGYYPFTSDPRYDVHAPWENLDSRLRATLFYPGAIEANPAFPPKNQFDPFNDPGDGIGRDQGTNTGFSWTKNVQQSDWSKGQNNGNNWKIFRYADVLLTFAEATNEVSGPTQDVIDAVNLIRARAKMPTVQATMTLRATPLTQQTMRDFIRHERRIEMAGEGWRYFDILRWKIAEQVLNRDIYTVDASAGISAISTSGGKVNTYPKTKIETRVFAAKNYVWPIPQSAIDASNGVLTQADEWK